MKEIDKMLVQKAWISYNEEKESLLNEKIKAFFKNSHFIGTSRPYYNGPLGIKCHMYNTDIKRTWSFLYNNGMVKFSYGIDKHFNESEVNIISKFCVDFFETNGGIILSTK